MADQQNQGAEAPKGTEAAAKPVDPKLLAAYVAEEVRGEAKNTIAYGKAAKAAGDDAARKAEAVKGYEKANEALRKGILGRLPSEADQAAYTKLHETESANIKAGLESIKGVTKLYTSAMAKIHDNPKTIMGASAALAAAGMLLPGKEVEKPDGGTEKKSGLFKKALVAVGAIVAIGTAMNKYGPAKGWAGKIAADRLAASAAKGASPSV